MSIYQKFCKETIDENGALKSIELDYPENFNFGYDVVDVIAGETPDKKAMVWCNTENEEHIFTFSDIKKYSDKMANVFKDAGIEKGDRVMVILKRHYEYWFAAIQSREVKSRNMHDPGRSTAENRHGSVRRRYERYKVVRSEGHGRIYESY